MTDTFEELQPASSNRGTIMAYLFVGLDAQYLVNAMAYI